MERPKRILIIADACSPLSQERGLVGLKGGHQIYWYSLPKADLKDLAGTVTSPMCRIRKLSFLFSPLFLKRAIRKIQPDLIHVFYAYHQLDNLILHRFKPLLVTVMGGDILTDQNFKGKKKWLTKKILEGADIITSKSDFLDRVLRGIGNYAHKTRRVTWGVDTQRFCPGIDVRFLRERWNLELDDIVFFSARNCQPFYNQDLIIKAFAIYQSIHVGKKRAILLISELFPEESYVKRLMGLVKEVGLQDKVHFLGSVIHQEMPAYFNLADIMVAIPRSDGMPQSLYEAMACGTYPILGDLPQYQEMVEDRVNGRLVKMGDVKALSEAMSWAADHTEHRKGAALINRKRILLVADKEVQEKRVNAIYEELLRK